MCRRHLLPHDATGGDGQTAIQWPYGGHTVAIRWPYGGHMALSQTLLPTDHAVSVSMHSTHQAICLQNPVARAMQCQQLCLVAGYSTDLSYVAAIAVAMLYTAACAQFAKQHAVCLCVMSDCRSPRLDQSATSIC